jgi:mannan endo-1,4-beta-mannosidase
MSDPAMVYDDYKKSNINPSTGVAIYTEGEKYPWNFYGYNYGNSTRTAHDNRDNRARSAHKPMLRMYRAVTGQSSNSYDTGVIDVFNAYLDVCADYCLLLQEQNIPVLFRPFHENSGDWFWWGNSGCEDENNKYCPEIFIRIWQYTVEYMYKKGVHNCIYVYSPNGSDFDNEEKMYTNAFRPYAITYPGDDWVDICAFDDYTTDESVMRGDIVTVANFAAKHSKIAAASEITGSPTDPSVTEFLFRSLTDTAHLPVNMAYMLQWTPPSFSPFLVSPTRANSSAANVLIKALNSKNVILANETNGFRPVKVNISN